MMAFPNFDTTTATWQRRTLRYLTIYLLLATALVTVRYFTQHIRPQLREVQNRETELIRQRDELEIRVQAATTPQKVQEWALQSGMQRFAERAGTAQNRDLGAEIPDPSTFTPNTTIEVNTQWK